MDKFTHNINNLSCSAITSVKVASLNDNPTPASERKLVLINVSIGDISQFYAFKIIAIRTCLVYIYYVTGQNYFNLV